MTKEEALQIITDTCKICDDKLREACAFFIPELKESEDEKMFNRVLMTLAGFSYFGGMEVSYVIEWLKSLKSQNKWKPTPSQLSALEKASNDYALSCDELARLTELYEQLKKL